jgi:hypothetical protein
MEIFTLDPGRYSLKQGSSKNIANCCRFVIIILLIIGSFFSTSTNVSRAASNSSDEPISNNSETLLAPDKSWYKKIETEWGGRLRLLGGVSRHDEDTIFGSVESGPYYDGNANLRLMNSTYLNQHTYFTIHYEANYSGGDTLGVVNELATQFPELLENGLIIGSPVSDDRRLFDLTHIIHEDSNSLLYHRLDRLSLTWQPQWGVVRIGRQAVTWGDGFLFNPFDLFNPFAPTDIIRDYKTGDDMINVQILENQIGDFQFLYVARRNPETEAVEFSQSSLAGKWHFAAGSTEIDVMAAEHFEDEIIGFGSRGYLGDAAWRMDATWTFLHADDEQDGFLSLVANMDYAWVWWQRNFYGFVEFYFNGLGNEDYSEALTDPAIIKRINRGEIYTLGRKYLATGIQIEVHPLFRVFFNSINNLADPSGILQPYAEWDLTQNLQLAFGGTAYYGGSETEYGGFTISGTDFIFKRPYGAFLWLTYYF